MLKERIRQLQERVDSLSLRERAIVFATALALVYLVWDTAIFESLERERVALEGAIEQSRLAVEKLNHQASLLAASRGVDPDDAERRIVASLRTEITRLNQALVEVTHHLVPPQDMARVLEAVLSRETELELLHLEGLGAEPLVGAAREGEGDAAPGSDAAPASIDEPLAVQSASLESDADLPAGLYRHGLRIEFRGSFLETMTYLAALERLRWRFLWDSVHYEVERYPRARVSIVVHSLSFDDTWIGV